MNTTDLDRYAELLVHTGVNLEPGQELFVDAYVEHAPLVRALEWPWYRAGAKRVDVFYADIGYDRKTTKPKPETLKALGADWLVPVFWGKK